MNWISRILLLLLGCLQASQCLRILIFHPIPWRSHQFVFRALARGLGARGHHVDLYTPVPMPDPPKSTSQIQVHDSLEEALRTVLDMDEFLHSTPLRNMEINYECCYFMMRKALTTGNAFAELMSSNRTYDIIVTEYTLWAEPLSYIAHRFDALNVVVTSLIDHPWTNEISGLPDNPSYMLSYQSRTNGEHDFVERFKNTFRSLMQICAGYRQLAYDGQVFADTYIRYKGWEKRPKLGEMVKDAALILLNSHPSMSHPYPRAPHVKEIGGLHVIDPQPLPKDLQDFLDGSPQGVIYFSLGTNIDAKAQTESVFDVLVKVFRKLDQNVLWKISPGMPQLEDRNIRMQEWYPQQDVLAHKNLVLFMTHGGLQSMVEAINSGVPILGMPAVFDQYKDVEFLTHSGMGLRLDFDNITEDSLSWTINEILSNPRYREQAKIRQFMFRDRPMKPLDEAIYWIEYVSRHGKILQPASVQLPFYQLYLLDVIGTISVGLLLTVYLTKLVVCAVWSLCSRKKIGVPKSKKNE